MKKIEFLQNIKTLLKSFDEESIIDEASNTLVFNVEEEDLMPSYKIAISVNDNNVASIYAAFKHKCVLKDELAKLYKKINEFNKDTFLKFIVIDNYIKIVYDIPELYEGSEENVLKIACLFPSMIAEFYVDLKKFL